MKKKFLWMLVPALVFGAVSCEKKDNGKQPADAGAAVEAPKDPKVTAPTPKPKASLSAAERAELVGFAQHLPQSTEYLITVKDGSDATRRIMASKLWRAFAEMSGMPGGAANEIGEEAAVEFTMGPAAMFGLEFTLAMGQGTSDQLGNLLVANSRLNYFQMSGLVKMFANAMDDGADPDIMLSGVNQFSEEFMLNLLNDEKSGVGLFEKTNMPPTYIAFKTTDENREMVNQQVGDSLQFMTFFQEMVKPVTAERGDATLKGYQLVGANIAESLKEEREDMEEVMSAETADRLIKAIADKNLYAVSGIYEEYVVLFIGSSLDDLVFAQGPESSLAGGDALTFCDAYSSKDLLAVFYGGEEGLRSIIDQAKGGFSDMAAGIRDGLASTDKFGDTRNLDALLRMVEDSEEAIQALGTVHGGGTVAFFEDGLKIESYGGYDSGFNNWKADNQLSSLGEGPDVMLFANVTSNADYDAKMRNYIETLFETAYAGAMKVADMPIESDDMVQFKNYMHLFDTKFRPDLLAFWEAFSGGYDGSLGQERALVMDLKGGMPAVPGLPQGVVDGGKIPRMTWIAPVNNRAKLASAWKKMNTSMTSMAGTISEMVGEEIPMQKPLSSDKDGSTTWFFPLPFFNDDFLPSVTVSDKWFAASTSKLQAVDLIAKANAGGDTTQGFVMKADFKLLQAYAKDMMGLMIKNAEDLDISAGDMEQANQIIDACAELDKMTIHVRREAGQLRSSFHFSVSE